MSIAARDMRKSMSELEIALEISRIEEAYHQIALQLELQYETLDKGKTATKGDASEKGSIERKMRIESSERKSEADVEAAASAATAAASAIAPTAASAKHSKTLVVDYWPSWSSNWTRDDLRAVPECVDILNIAFALPDGKGGLLWHDDINPTCTKDRIKELQTRGKKILISVGGATAHHWNLNSVDPRLFAKNIKEFVDSYGLNGVDIDFESPTERERLIPLIKALRDIMPKDKYYISYAGWSIGAYGIKGHEHREWDSCSNKGIDIKVLSEIGELLDWVNVMSYDAFDPGIKPAYNPTEAIAAFKDLLGNRPDKVLLGVLIGKHSWPSGTITPSSQVRPWVEFAIKNNYRGVMHWVLQRDIARETGEAPGVFTEMVATLVHPERLVNPGRKVKAQASLP